TRTQATPQFPSLVRAHGDQQQREERQKPREDHQPFGEANQRFWLRCLSGGVALLIASLLAIAGRAGTFDDHGYFDAERVTRLTILLRTLAVAGAGLLRFACQ